MISGPQIETAAVMRIKTGASEQRRDESDATSPLGRGAIDGDEHRDAPTSHAARSSEEDLGGLARAHQDEDSTKLDAGGRDHLLNAPRSGASPMPPGHDHGVTAGTRFR